MSQREQILKALKRGEKLTPLVALRDYRVLALSQRIGELVRSGHPVVRSRLAVGNKRVGLYYLPVGHRR